MMTDTIVAPSGLTYTIIAHHRGPRAARDGRGCTEIEVSWLEGGDDRHDWTFAHEGQPGHLEVPTEDADAVQAAAAALITEELTDDMVRALHDGAGAAGDRAQVNLAKLALRGRTKKQRFVARQRCADAINNARAMLDYTTGGEPMVWVVVPEADGEVQR